MKAWGVLLIVSLPGPVAHAFTLNGSSSLRGWDTTELTFKINRTDCLSKARMDSTLDAAFSVWNAVATADLEMKLGEDTATTAANGFNENGTNPPMIACDSSLSTTLPGVGSTNNIPGATKIDASVENLSVDKAVILFNAEPAKQAMISNLSITTFNVVAAHEVGHVLGLGHTEDKSALMYFDASAKTTLRLSQDDMDGMTYLYPRGELLGGSGFFGCGAIQLVNGGGAGKLGDFGPWSRLGNSRDGRGPTWLRGWLTPPTPLRYATWERDQAGLLLTCLYLFLFFIASIVAQRWVRASGWPNKKNNHRSVSYFNNSR